jgi:Response regulators consisting of a CheY-like receiver domain and a winged-helix DNA-binding domain
MKEYGILIVEDDLSFARALKDFFEENDFEVTHVVSGEEAIDVYEKNPPSTVLLDVILPGINGFEVMERIMQIDNSIPVIIMTGTENSEDCQMKGFDMRVINYLQKPFSLKVLLAQIKNRLKPVETKIYNLNGTAIIIQLRELKINDSIYKLREKDIHVLTILLDKKTIVVTREKLLQSVWKSDVSEFNRHLDASIHRLKAKLINHPEIKIESIYGVGYRICQMDQVAEK